MTFKLNSNDKTRVTELANKLLVNGIRTHITLNPNDQSDCKWRWIDNPINAPWSPANKWRSRLSTGGVGALIMELKEACFAHGIMKRAPHISNRSHVRLAINGNPVWTTSNGG